MNFHEFHGISGFLRFQGAQKWVDSEPCPAPSRLKEINRGFSILNGKEGGGRGVSGKGLSSSDSSYLNYYVGSTSPTPSKAEYGAET